MNFKNFGLILLCNFFIFNITLVFAQSDVDTEQIIESITENVTEDFDYSELTDRLSYYQKNPINLNKAKREQLQELIFLSPIQINALLQHIKENGNLLDLLELQTIEGYDIETIKNLEKYVSIGVKNSLNNVSLNKLLTKSNHDMLMRYGQLFQDQKGFTIPDSINRSKYLGSPMRLFTRYRYNYGQHISASLNMEKDAGEQFLSGPDNRGFDFYSGNISILNLGKVSHIVLGDYSLQFGQGLSLWSGLGFGKGAAIITLAKQDLGLRSYTSANESSFFRGTSATIKLNNFSFTPFISYKNVDASLNAIDTNEVNDVVGSLGISGLHRTESELINKNSVSQLVYGSNVQFNAQKFRIGFTGYQTSFGRKFESGKALYNKFEFADKSLTNFSFHYNYSLKNTYFFGEVAHSLGSGYAFLNGMVSSIAPQVSILLLHRNYQKDYHSFFNQAISEASNAVNEKGFYSGIVIKPGSKWELTSYADFFQFPWLKFGVDAPSKGYELFSQLVYSPSKQMKVIGRFKLEERQENDDLENTVNTLQQVTKQNYRLEINYKINKVFTLRNRLEIVQFQKEQNNAQHGYLMYQDVIYGPLQSKFSGNIRFAIFDTPGFNSRIYAYENDVLYSYSVLAYQNRGLRYYINGRYTLKKGMDFWLRYSLINYINKEVIGSGLDQIDGHIRSDIKFQIRYQF